MRIRQKAASGPEIKVARAGKVSWTDERLVRECLKGSNEAWSALIDKYKNLIFSIPIKYQLSPEDASDIFQGVCLDLLSELPRLQQPRALPAWLIKVASHRCFHHNRHHRRFAAVELHEETSLQTDGDLPEDVLHQLEREQILREALLEMSPRCHQLLQMLFFEEPARPYQDIAARLGLKTGSVGFIRMRCLKRLKQALEKKGFK
ncbi:MAG TPA: sigma-70 family RNA polymerase sigma factor [Acidobacteriota bacterium]|jgi:RNA polymerase sigma factor (sigma-70 family)